MSESENDWLTDALAEHRRRGNACCCGEYVAAGARLNGFFDRDVATNHEAHVAAVLRAAAPCSDGWRIGCAFTTTPRCNAENGKRRCALAPDHEQRWHDDGSAAWPDPQDVDA